MDIIDHIAIRVTNLEEAKEWYLQHLDAEIAFEDHKYIRLKAKNVNIALIDQQYYSHAHIGILVDSQDKLPDYGQRVEHRDGTVGVYVKDPSGNYIEYIWYAPKHEDVFLK